MSVSTSHEDIHRRMERRIKHLRDRDEVVIKNDEGENVFNEGCSFIFTRFSLHYVPQLVT
jgi:hypothetical protein